MENLYINWRAIIFVIVFIFISINLIRAGLRWMVETSVINKNQIPRDISIQCYLFWIGKGLQTIFWLIFLFLAFFVERVC